MIRTMMAAILLAGLACSGALANPRIDNIDTEVMRSVAERLGHEVIGEVRLGNGRPVVMALQPTGLTYTLLGTACEERVCLGMASVIKFVNDTGLTTDNVNQMNADWLQVKIVLRDEEVEIWRYDVVHDDTTIEGLAASVRTLVDVTHSMQTSHQ